MGGILAKNIGNKEESNYSAGLYFDAIFIDQPIIGSRLKININQLGFFGMNFNFVNYYRDSVDDFRFIPEINFSLYDHMNIFAGYNINLTENQFEEIGNLKFGLNINLVR